MEPPAPSGRTPAPASRSTGPGRQHHHLSTASTPASAGAPHHQPRQRSTGHPTQSRNGSNGQPSAFSTGHGGAPFSAPHRPRPPQSGTASPITLTPTKLDPSRQPSSLPDPYQIWVALPLHQRSNSRAAANRSKSSPPPLAASEPLPPPPPPPPPLSHTPSVLYRSIAPTHELLDLPSSSPSPSPCALQTSLCARPLPCLVARVFRPSRLPLASKPPPPDSSG